MAAARANVAARIAATLDRYEVEPEGGEEGGGEEEGDEDEFAARGRKAKALKSRKGKGRSGGQSPRRAGG
eukprot:2255721-Prymnesium_polylepis.1